MTNPGSPQLTYACSSCPACSCAARNTAQNAVADAPLGPHHIPGMMGGEYPVPQARGAGVVASGPYAAQLAALKVNAPHRTFTRAEVLAVLKSRKSILEDRPHFAEAVRELDALISIFERME